MYSVVSDCVHEPLTEVFVFKYDTFYIYELTAFPLPIHAIRAAL